MAAMTEGIVRIPGIGVLRYRYMRDGQFCTKDAPGAKLVCVPAERKTNPFRGRIRKTMAKFDTFGRNTGRNRMTLAYIYLSAEALLTEHDSFTTKELDAKYIKESCFRYRATKQRVVSLLTRYQKQIGIRKDDDGNWVRR